MPVPAIIFWLPWPIQTTRWDGKQKCLSWCLLQGIGTPLLNGSPKNIFTREERLAYFPAEDEVRMGDIQTALSFSYLSWKFLMAPDGPDAWQHTMERTLRGQSMLEYPLWA